MTDTIDPITFELLRHRLTAINDEATFTIMQVSANQIATEANDLNSALMTADGEVVVFGVWILVHSCSLNTLVQRLLADYAENPGIRPGDMFLCNDPYITGRHQLDVIVVAPIFEGDRLIAWTGTIVHQNDVGGPVPGGFAVGAHTIYEEAIPMAPMKIVEQGTIRRDIEAEYLIRSRTPELNRLDLLAQIAANRLHGNRVLELCEHYGTATFLATLTRLLDSTEARLRQRLAQLPDGRWRHIGHMEHDGVADNVYRISLTATKIGDHLDLDFTDSSDQAQGMVNAAHGTMRCFALVSLLAMLGFDDMPWVPGAFERVVTFRTRPGTVTQATWPAGVSMSGTAAGQEVRTAVQQCLAAMLDASDEWSAKIMTSGITSAPGIALSGHNINGDPFSSILVDAVGGGGARRIGDGVDTAGALHTPGSTTSNIEVNELNFPVLYLHRYERSDSGGPGLYRGGVGAGHALLLHPPCDEMELTLFGHGVQQPSSAGHDGGEPGRQNGFLFQTAADQPMSELIDGSVVVTDHYAPPPKYRTVIGPNHIFTSWSAGGGGIGDPIERDPIAVCADVNEGLVSVEGAEIDYKVLLQRSGREWLVDVEGTTQLRDQERKRRLQGREPAARGAAHGGRRLSHSLELVHVAGQSVIACRHCGFQICEQDQNVKLSLVLDEAPTWQRWPLSEEYEGATRFVLRRFYCPSCAVQMFVEVNLRDESPVYSIEVLPEHEQSVVPGSTAD